MYMYVYIYIYIYIYIIYIIYIYIFPYIYIYIYLFIYLYNIYINIYIYIYIYIDSRFLSMVLGAQWLIFRVVKVLYYTYIILFGFGRLCFRTSFSDNPFSLYTIFIIIRIGSRTFAGSWVEFFLVIVNGFQPFALVMKSSILDLAGFLEPSLFNIIIL